MNKLSKSNAPIFIWSCLWIAIVIFLSFNFFPIVDDLCFAGAFGRHELTFPQIITVSGVNGRYLGNTLGIFFSWLSTTDFWYLRAIFNIVCIVLLFYFIIKSIGFNKTSLYFVPLLMLTPEIHHFHQYYGFSAVFMNYLLPLLIFFINVNLVKYYIAHESKSLLLIPIFISVFLNCFFVEHITVYILLCCTAVFIYSLLKKTYIKLGITLLISGVAGTACMFMSPLIYSSGSLYRDSALSKGLSFIFKNIGGNIPYLIFDHMFLTGFISLVCFLCLVKFTGKSKVKKAFALPILCILCLSCASSFLLYFGNWKDTVLSIFINDIFVMILSFAFLIAIGAVIIFYIPKDKINGDVYFYYVSIWVICGMLSAVSPIGPRCFMVVYSFFVIISIRIFSALYGEIKPGIKSVIYAGCLAVFCITSVFICDSYYDGKKVMNERFDYIEEQLKLGEKEIVVPDSVNFTDCGGLNFLNDYFSINNIEGTELKFVPYDEWLTVK